MRRYLLVLIFILFMLYVSFQQLNIPLQHKKVIFQESLNVSRHHLLRQSQNKNQHHKPSKICHNLGYIMKHFNQQHKEQNQVHNLNREYSVNDHLKLQTFNLKPNAYSFSLQIKIAGYNYSMSIDSGSSDIFIKGQKSKGKPKNRYQCGQTCIKQNPHYQIGYLDGRLQTYQAKLQVEIGDHKFKESILVAYNVQHNFQENQGLVGLSFSQLASNPNPTFLQTLKNQQIISNYGFGVNLNFQSLNRSFITFGTYDKQFFQGDLNMLPLTSRLFYYVQSQGVSIGQGPVLKIGTALFDTGNTCISIPIKYQSEILKQFNSGFGNNQNKCFFSVQAHAQMFSVLRCKFGSLENLPTLNIHLNKKVYKIEKQYYLQACDRRPKQMSQGSKNKQQGFWYCDLYVESVKGMSQLFLGDGFFNRFYTYFDLQKKQIGIARNRQKIQMQKIIDNELDADEQSWQQILINLNPEQDSDDISEEVKRVVESEQQDSDEYYE